MIKEDSGNGHLSHFWLKIFRFSVSAIQSMVKSRVEEGSKGPRVVARYAICLSRL